MRLTSASIAVSREATISFAPNASRTVSFKPPSISSFKIVERAAHIGEGADDRTRMMHDPGEALRSARDESERLGLARYDVVRRGLAAIFENAGIRHIVAFDRHRESRAVVFEIGAYGIEQRAGTRLQDRAGEIGSHLGFELLTQGVGFIGRALRDGIGIEIDADHGRITRR